MMKINGPNHGLPLPCIQQVLHVFLSLFSNTRSPSFVQSSFHPLPENQPVKLHEPYPLKMHNTKLSKKGKF